MQVRIKMRCLTNIDIHQNKNYLLWKTLIMLSYMPRDWETQMF